GGPRPRHLQRLRDAGRQSALAAEHGRPDQPLPHRAEVLPARLRLRPEASARMSRATAIVGAIAAAALLVVGYSLYAGAQKRAQQKNVIERVRDSTGKLRQALAPRPAPALV